MSWFKSRSNIILSVLLLLMALLGVRLIYIIAAEGEVLAREADSNTVKTIATDAPRGSIYDRNGVLLAGNKPVHTVTFARNGMAYDKMNDSLRRLVEILDYNAEVFLTSFPIEMNSDGEFSYTFERDIVKWLKENGLPEDTSARDAFDAVRARNNIDPALDDYEAQLKLIDAGDNPPIGLYSEGDKSIEYRKISEKENFFERFGVQYELPPADMLNIVLKEYGIDQMLDLPIETALKIAAIRNEIAVKGYLQYIPVKVSQNIKPETIIQLEEQEHDLLGVSVGTETIRYYPYGQSASQIIGYLGKISDGERAKYVDELGYKPDDMIGLSGVEMAMEDTLHGSDGFVQLQIDSIGNTVRTVGEETLPKKGEDIVLTIDLRLQQACEQALETTLANIRQKTNAATNVNAKVGAAVVLDVKTGEPLAIADTNGFDPNLFSEGISEENWKMLQGENPRDPMAPRPLYSTAVRTAVQPGSIFKPLTGIVALESGLDANHEVKDKQYLKYGDYTYSCMGSHGNVNLFTGLQNSCNYYFYDVASGMDWAKGGEDLGYKDNISIEKISEYALQFGLGVESGIEMQETVITPPSEKKKIDSTMGLLANYLISESETYFEQDIINDYSVLEKNVNTIVSWYEEDLTFDEIEKRLHTLGVKSNKAYELADMVRHTYFDYATWTMGDVFNIAIGQGEAAYTPLQMARFVATIGNYGTLNDASLIKAKETVGEVARKPGVSTKVSNPQFFKDVIEGMRLVVEKGSMTSLKSLSVNVAAKTGTAERSGFVPPPSEVEYMKTYLPQINPELSWEAVEAEMYRLMAAYPKIYDSADNAVRRAVINLSGAGFSTKNLDAFKSKYGDFAWNIALAPTEDPEIAVVVLLVQGGTSLNAIPTTKSIISSYLKIKKADEKLGFTMDYDNFFKEDNRDNTLETVFTPERIKEREEAKAEAASAGAVNDSDTTQ